MQTIQIQLYQSPCGELLLGSFNDKLCMCDWTSNQERRTIIDKRIQKGLQASFEMKDSEVIMSAITQLDEYFSNQRKEFDIPLLLVGTTFQKSVWSELTNIPYGKTISYSQVSQMLNNPKAIRAVANSIGANAISIFIPCHRVIGSNHQLTGYAGGLEAKEKLLNLESIHQHFSL